MITHEPLPLYEAFSFLTGIANDFSIEEFFEAMYIKHISKAEEYGKRCRILSELYRRLAASVTAEPEKLQLCSACSLRAAEHGICTSRKP